MSSQVHGGKYYDGDLWTSRSLLPSFLRLDTFIDTTTFTVENEDDEWTQNAENALELTDTLGQHPIDVWPICEFITSFSFGINK